MICDELYNKLTTNILKKKLSIPSEDGENGATIDYEVS